MKSILIFIFLIVFVMPSAFAKKADIDFSAKKDVVQSQKLVKSIWSKGLKSGSPSKRYYPEASSPVFADGFIYVGTHGKEFYAVNAETGKMAWTFKNEFPIDSEPRVADGKVFFTDLEGHVLALSASEGTLIWSQKFDAEILGQPLVANGQVYLLKGEKEILVLSAETGDVRWQKPIPTYAKDITMRGQSPVLLEGSKLYVGTASGIIYALQAGSGQTLWQENLATPLSHFKDIDHAMILDEDSLYVSGYFGRLYRMNKASGRVQWTADVTTGVLPLILSDRIIVSDTSGTVVAFDKKTGSELWSNELKGSLLSAPVAFLNYIFVASYDGTAYVLDVTTGIPLQKVSVGSGSITAPFAAAGKIFLLTNSAKLMAFGSY